jgi:hypothetical protein
MTSGGSLKRMSWVARRYMSMSGSTAILSVTVYASPSSVSTLRSRTFEKLKTGFPSSPN